MRDLNLVFGTGLSGVAACELLLKNNEKVVLFDENTAFKKDEFYNNHQALLGVEIYLGDIPKDVIDDIKRVILSPGIPINTPRVNSFKDAGIEIIGEIELAYIYSNGQLVAITGTNGKTTTTALVGHILKEAYSDVRVVGNIGTPFTSSVDNMSKDTHIVAEISSFQLETVTSFRPDISAILNITPDHLDRHGSMDGYIEAKKSIVKNQDKEGLVVLNYEDKVLREFGSSLEQRVVFFSSKQSVQNGLYLKNDHIFLEDDDKVIDVIAVDKLNIIGEHNYENAMAAIAMAYYTGVGIDKIQKALITFKAVEHRIEFTCEKKGVKYYDDSKGTNTDAAIKALLAMPGPTVLIAGGYDKGADYSEWVSLFEGRVKKLILIGQTAKTIAIEANKIGFSEVIFSKDLRGAVNEASQIANPGDCVLLSPACASWGMFRDFNERGDLFKQYARELED